MAWPFSRQRALTASVTTVPHDKNTPIGPTTAGGVGRQRDRQWQEDGWRAFKSLGEVRFAARYTGNALARCRFFIGTRESLGDKVVPIADDSKPHDKEYRNLLDRVRPRTGDFSSLVRVYGVQQFVAGENFLVGEDGIEGERWEFLSTSELRRVGRNGSGPGKVIVTDQTFPQYEKLQPDGTAIVIDPNSVVLRFWTRDPEWRERADSPLRPVLDICEALNTAQAMQIAGDRSRLGTAGLMLVPTEADLPKAPMTDNAGGPQQPPRLMLVDELLEAMNVAMTEPGSPTSLIPIIAEVRSDLIALFKHITFDRQVDTTIVARIDHLIRRLAQGLDIPPEIMLGLGDVSHWTAWAVSEQAVGDHIIPMGTNFCEDMTVGYLRPLLSAMGEPDLDRYAVGFDPSDLIVSPNQADHAFMAYDRHLLSADHLMWILGLDPSMRPELKEIIEQILISRATNPHNPDPGADIAALLGKAPPPLGAERTVKGLPPQDQPQVQPVVPEQNPNAPTKGPTNAPPSQPGVAPPSGQTPEQQDAQRRGTPQTSKIGPGRPSGQSREGRKSGVKGGRGIKKTSADVVDIFGDDDDEESY